MKKTDWTTRKRWLMVQVEHQTFFQWAASPFFPHCCPATYCYPTLFILLFVCAQYVCIHLPFLFLPFFPKPQLVKHTVTLYGNNNNNNNMKKIETQLSDKRKCIISYRPFASLYSFTWHWMKRARTDQTLRAFHRHTHTHRTRSTVVSTCAWQSTTHFGYAFSSVQ